MFNLYINIKKPFGVLVTLKLNLNLGPSQNLWFTWVDRMFIGLKDKWEYLGMADAILTSKSPIKPDLPLIAALISFWSTTSNTFVFSEGFFIPYSNGCLCKVESPY